MCFDSLVCWLSNRLLNAICSAMSIAHCRPIIISNDLTHFVFSVFIDTAPALPKVMKFYLLFPRPFAQIMWKWFSVHRIRVEVKGFYIPYVHVTVHFVSNNLRLIDMYRMRQNRKQTNFVVCATCPVAEFIVFLSFSFIYILNSSPQCIRNMQWWVCIWTVQIEPCEISLSSLNRVAVEKWCVILNWNSKILTKNQLHNLFRFIFIKNKLAAETVFTHRDYYILSLYCRRPQPTKSIRKQQQKLWSDFLGFVSQSAIILLLIADDIFLSLLMLALSFETIETKRQTNDRKN